MKKFKLWIIKTFDKLTNRINNRSEFKEHEHVIKYAFTSGGTKYYQLDDVFNLPYQRGLEAVHAYEEIEMRCDKKYLMNHSKLIDDLLSSSIGLEELGRIKAANDQLRQRLTWIVVPDQVYKLASIVFFDKNEDPNKYELAYSRKKIEKWKKDDDIEAFFLRQPVQKLLPFLSELSGNLEIYSMAIDQLDKTHLKNLYTRFSENRGKKPFVKQ